MRKRIVTAAIAASLLAGAMGPPSNAQEAQQQESRRERRGRFQWVDPGTWTAREERLTTAWAVQRWPVEGGTTKFTAVGACESGWNRFAYNPNGHAGLFQHDTGAWSGRVSTYIPRWLRAGPFTRWTNSRSQIIVTARMVNLYGWGAWTCA
jgi:Ni/Co efflux regulator RcnB